MKATALKPGNVYTVKDRAPGQTRRVRSISKRGAFVTVAYDYLVTDDDKRGHSTRPRWYVQSIPCLERLHVNKRVELTSLEAQTADVPNPFPTAIPSWMMPASVTP